MEENVVLRVSGVVKRYARAGGEVKVLEDINLEVRRGEFIALMGPSGSGKTTLLNIIGGLDSPSGGSVVVDGADVSALGDRELAAWRSASIGFVFQHYNLLPVLTAVENVELPLLLFDMGRRERRERALAALELVGLGHRAAHLPRQMSGGEEQRTAIARAMVTDPKLIVADEPTGNLDAVAAKNVLDLLESLSGDLKKAIVMVTHDPVAAARADRLVHLRKGELVAETGGVAA